MSPHFAHFARLLFAWAMACAMGQSFAQTDKIVWHVQDRPPMFFYVGGRPPKTVADLGNGEFDGYMRLLIQRLPQYQHEFVNVSLPRFEAMAKQGLPVCSLVMLHTPERSQWLYFTPLFPPLVSHQIKLVVRQDKLAQFKFDGQVLHLADVLRRRDLTGLLARHRSFGSRIDAALKARGAQAPNTIVAVRNLQMLDMLRAGRMSYTLEFLDTVLEYERTAGPGPALATLAIDEGLVATLFYAACARNAEGRESIEAIDLAERRIAQDPQRETLVRAWRGNRLEEADRQRLYRYMDERARSGAQIE